MKTGKQIPEIIHYHLKAQYKQSSFEIEICGRENNWSFGVDILFKESRFYRGRSFAPLEKWNMFKTEFECKKAAIDYILHPDNSWEEWEQKIAHKLRSSMYRKASALGFLGIDKNSLTKTLRALDKETTNEKRTKRCCMCPNNCKEDIDNDICPGIEGILHPEPSPCEFVLQFIDNNGEIVFVSKGLGKTYMSFRTKNGVGLHRVKTKSLPERKFFDEAQADLNKYAQLKHWRVNNT